MLTKKYRLIKVQSTNHLRGHTNLKLQIKSKERDIKFERKMKRNY